MKNHKLLVELMSHVKNVQRQLQSVQVRMQGHEGGNRVEAALPEDFRLPLERQSAVNDLEEFLDSPANEKLLLNELMFVGGENLQQTIWSIMGTLMSRQVATLNCWDGTVDRKRFRGTRLHSVVCKAVRLNKNTASSSNDDIKEGLKAFFRNAKKRAGLSTKKPAPTEIVD